MFKKLLLIFSAVLALIFAGYKIIQTHRSHKIDVLQPAWTQQILASYDTGSSVVTIVKDSILHFTLSWVNEAETSLPTTALQSLGKRKQPLFINLQIWSRGSIKKFDEDIAAVILSGVYDRKLISLFSILAENKHTIYLRYNGEMELPMSSYPWQNKSCMEYIRSFRHIVLLCKKYSPAVKIVWGPAGYPGAEEYWPGDGYVDLVSVNMSLTPEWSNDPYPAYSSVTEMMRRKLFRMRFMNKPVLFLGSATISRASLQQQWLNELNSKLAMDKAIYRTPLIPVDTDTILSGKNRQGSLKIGVYDPLLLLADQPLVTTEHLFPNIGTVKDGSFKKEFDGVIARHHDVIVTMESWKDGKREKDPSILINTLNGSYDAVWAGLYRIISNVPQTIYLRWGHEMEIPVDRYPWQEQDPVIYTKAFRYFANFQQPRAANIKMVWGPAGDRGSVEWWPGEDVVDFISVAIYALPDKNINDYNRQRSFTSIFLNKLHRMRFTHRPIFITEFGVKGPEAFQKKWLEEAAATINNHPEIIGVSYFNFADTPKAWGDAETPDWSITGATFKSFTDRLKGLPKH